MVMPLMAPGWKHLAAKSGAELTEGLSHQAGPQKAQKAQAKTRAAKITRSVLRLSS